LLELVLLAIEAPVFTRRRVARSAAARELTLEERTEQIQVGQYTAFDGIEYAREGNCHFAGEHTSIDFQGYLNGAVETGQRAAADILADLK
jgi:monoamine oxidase